MAAPTAVPELNQLLTELVDGVQKVLADAFVGAYLAGSFALGDWDHHSDVDFLIVTVTEIDTATEAALQAMHGRIFDLPTPWAQHLDGSYFPARLLRRADPAATPLLYLDNGSRALVRSSHDNELVVRWVVREHGIPLAGPPPRQLIDPVDETALKQEVAATMHTWGDEILHGRYRLTNRWAQPFAALSYGRMLHTLHTGQIHSKLAAVQWAPMVLEERWVALLQRAWAERPYPSQKIHMPANPADTAETIAFIRHVLAKPFP